MNDVLFESAGQLATRIRRRELGSRELLDLYLARVEKHNPALNAIVTLDAERARARAAQADDAAKRGEWWGPLHGLPITIKDTLETAGLRTTADYAGLAEHVPAAARPAFGLSEVVRVYEALLWPILLAGHPPEVFERLAAHAATHPDDPSPLGRMARHGTSRHRDWIIANEFREQLRAKLAAFFREYDVLLMPVNQVPAIRHDHSEPMTERVIPVNGRSVSYYDLLGWISLATLSHHPATSAPVGCTQEGLPVGIQILAPYLEDRTSIGFAALMAPILEERGLVSSLRKP